MYNNITCISDNTLQHHGVKGMKWGVRKSDYKSMTRQQRKDVRQKYYNTPEGKIKRATSIGTVIAGPIGGVIAGTIANKRLNSVPAKTIDKGKTEVDKLMTDEQKINKLIQEGKAGGKAKYTFDQNGNLFMVTWDD